MDTASQFNSIARWLTWVLRIALVLQVWGAAAKYLFIEFETETPLFGLLAFDWLWPEPRVQQIDDISVWLNFYCGIAVLALAVSAEAWSQASGRASWLQRWMFLWQTPLLLVTLLWELATVTAGYVRLEWFMPPEFKSTGTPLEQVEMWLISEFSSHAVRWGIPLTLILLTPLPGKLEIGSRRFDAAMWVVRVATSLTFLSHGLKAIYLQPLFIDYVLTASDQLLGYKMPQSTAELLLQLIGYIDLVLASLLVAGRFRSVAFYMAAWCLITACSRMVHGGSGRYFEVLIRGGNYGMPLVAAIYFVWFHKHAASLLPRTRTGDRESVESPNHNSE